MHTAIWNTGLIFLNDKQKKTQNQNQEFVLMRCEHFPCYCSINLVMYRIYLDCHGKKKKIYVEH